ncbi:MAG TPA: HD domain-containing protein [Syntrophomonadaceae bacterium]|nr:HD domain-containing protein [Syntrophomonadaceae bacterium]
MLADWERTVLENNIERERLILSKYACSNQTAFRVKPEPIPDEVNVRPAFFHDTDRIIHSLAYSRYIDKTQVFFLFENDHITHRVLHVQLVSKIARTIGRFLRLNEDLIESIALGHDLGHTPFGHDGEKYLNTICEEQGIGYFRHNAQSVRFLTELENFGEGWNLTMQVLDGILCHNGEEISEHYEPAPTKTKEQCCGEYQSCLTQPAYGKELKPFTLEGCVVRVCDVIAYIGRDIEDAITVELMTRDQIPEEIANVLGKDNRSIIDALVRDLVNRSFDQPYLSFSTDVLKALKSLRDFNYKTIYFAPEKQEQDSKIEKMFRVMFEIFLDHLKKENTESRIFKDFPIIKNGNYRNSTPEARIIVDYIAGMTDDYFLNTFRELFLPRRYGMSLKEQHQ